MIRELKLCVERSRTDKLMVFGCYMIGIWDCRLTDDVKELESLPVRSDNLFERVEYYR